MLFDLDHRLDTRYRGHPRSFAGVMFAFGFV